jgi:hypothetical protein
LHLALDDGVPAALPIAPAVLLVLAGVVAWP